MQNSCSYIKGFDKHPQDKMLRLFSGVLRKKEKRVALVFGNASYSELGHLRCSRQDALRMHKTLKSLGFKGDLFCDASRDQMNEAILEFSKVAHDADVVFVYFSGHGTQLDGENYLLPVDAGRQISLNSMNLLRLEAILRQINNQVGKTIVVLDACRDLPPLELIGEPPLETPGQPNVPTTVVTITKSGMADAHVTAEEANQTIIAFATAPGKVAYEGDPGDKVSPFTGALLRHIRRPGVNFYDLLQDIIREVSVNTGFRQQPWVNLSVQNPIFLRGRLASPVLIGIGAGLVSVAAGWYSAERFNDIKFVGQSLAPGIIYGLAIFFMIWRWSRSASTTALALIMAIFAFLSAVAVADFVNTTFETVPSSETDPDPISLTTERTLNEVDSKPDDRPISFIVLWVFELLGFTFSGAADNEALSKMLPAPLAAVSGGLLTMLGVAIAVPATRRVRYFLSALSYPTIVAFIYATLALQYDWDPYSHYFQFGIWSFFLVTICGYVIGNARHEMLVDEQPIFPPARLRPVLWAAAGGVLSAILCGIYITRDQLLFEVENTSAILRPWLTGILLQDTIFELDLDRIVPGAIFGILVGSLTLRLTRERVIPAPILFIVPVIGTTLGWYTAYFLGSPLFDLEDRLGDYPFLGVVGAIGGAITLLSCALVNHRFWRIIFWIVTLFSAAACGLTYIVYGALVELLMDNSASYQSPTGSIASVAAFASSDMASWISLFVIWQPALAACIAYALTARAPHT